MTLILTSVSQINDSPRFPHRGLMVDTARHYETLPALRAIVDSLVYAKINVRYRPYSFLHLPAASYHPNVLARWSSGHVGAAGMQSCRCAGAPLARRGLAVIPI